MGGRRTGDRGQRTEVRGQRTEGRGWRCISSCSSAPLARTGVFAGCALSGAEGLVFIASFLYVQCLWHERGILRRLAAGGSVYDVGRADGTGLLDRLCVDKTMGYRGCLSFFPPP